MKSIKVLPPPLSALTVAVLGVTGLIFATAAQAQSKTIIIDNNTPSIETPVYIIPTDKDGSGKFLQNNADKGYAKDITFGKQTDKAVGYIKNRGGSIGIDNLKTEAGTKEKPTIGTLEFFPAKDGEDDPREKSFSVVNATLEENSVLRILKTNYASGDKHIKGKTTVQINEITMKDRTAIALGVGLNDKDKLKPKQTADEVIINKINVEDGADYVGIVSGKNISGLKTNNDTVKVEEINIKSNLFDLSGQTKIDGTGAISSDLYTGVRLLGVNGTINVNMLASGSQIHFGGIGEEPNTKAGDAATTPTVLNINFSKEALAGAKSSVEFSTKVATGTTVNAVATEGGSDSAKTTADVANEVLGKVFTSGNVANLGEGVEKTVTVNPFDVMDGAVYDVAANGSDAPTLGNVVHVMENPVVYGVEQLAVLNVMQWRDEMNHMQYRLGEIRDTKGYSNGVWARAYGGKDKYGSQNVENEYFAFQAGYDHRLEGTNVILGGALSYAKGDASFDAGDGDNHSITFTAYGTWLADNGMFLDVTGKYGRLSNEVTVAQGTGSYDNNAVAVTAEAGWRFALSNLFYVEPQAEAMYGHIWSADYSLGALQVKQDAVDNIVGRLGVQTGLVCPDNKGSLYLRASVLHDFDGETSSSYTMTGTRVLETDLGGTWYELGIGGNINVTNTTSLYADFQYSDGDEIESPWRASVGVRYVW